MISQAGQILSPHVNVKLWQLLKAKIFHLQKHGSLEECFTHYIKLKRFIDYLHSI
jgi:hypothetical protein